MDHGNYINGQWQAAAGGATFERRNPADTRDLVGRFPESGEADVRAAVDAARAALPAWRRLTGDARAQFLRRAANLLEARKDAVAAALTREEGKTLAESGGETGRGVVLLRYYAGEGLRAGGDVLPSASPGTLLFTERVPLGVVGLITPWNFPVAIPLWKIAPALIYGNTVVLKPSELAPRTAHLIAEVLHEAGLPPGVFNLVQGARAAGEALVNAPGVDGISFTGSVATGKSIARACVERGAKYQLEMGGKNPVIVLEDADMAQAVELTVQGAMRSAGEKCTATSRAIVVESVADEFTRRVVERVRHLEMGPGTDARFYLGPLISVQSRDRVLRYVEQAKAEGARLLCGGTAAHRPDLAHGYYVWPAVLDNVRPDMAIAQEEVFGPVLAILRVPDFDRALAVANGVPFGLSASLFTRDLGSALRFAREIDAGLVRVNGETAGVEPQAPFGGMKASSSFSREQGQAAREFYTQVKTISFDKAGA
uniref:2,5-dioxovalerate dehydrogenase n=1 Tax=uncultured Armatimonadetes bacterium TaxID=157466 RepID=A0A6J4IJU2_9BACT|nr:2,5-dioxovalerate dehydrogenase [uncultured Armatimonadetes bacterium]